MSEWTGLIGALLGGAVGFFAVWWQHRAQTKEQIRMKVGELVYVGEQYLHSRLRVTLISDDDARDSQDLQHARADQMTAILRYLELTASDKVFQMARDYCAATSVLTVSSDIGVTGSEKAQIEAQRALVKELKRR